jgi:hypothetical protein
MEPLTSGKGTNGCDSAVTASALNTQKLFHLLIKEALSGTVGLHPVAIDYELRDCPFARVLDDLFGSPGRGLNIDFLVGDVVLREEPFGFAAV